MSRGASNDRFFNKGARAEDGSDGGAAYRARMDAKKEATAAAKSDEPRVLSGLRKYHGVEQMVRCKSCQAEYERYKSHGGRCMDCRS